MTLGAVAVISGIGAGAFFLGSGSVDREEIRREGYDEGFGEGRSEGYSEGLVDGESSGRSEGYQSGFAEGCEMVFDQVGYDYVTGYDPYGYDNYPGSFYYSKWDTCP